MEHNQIMDKDTNNVQATANTTSQPWQTMTFAAYVQLRNGVPLGDPDSLRNMLSRSLGAGSFAEFWRYWNPIWGYGLGKYVYAPLRRLLPSVLALLMTFVVSGVLHDLAAMAIRRSITFFVTPWFFLLGVGVVLGRLAGMQLAHLPWWVRATVNLTYLVGCLVVVLIAKQLSAIP
jgi:hypothetical protein